MYPYIYIHTYKAVIKERWLFESRRKTWIESEGGVEGLEGIKWEVM